MRNLGPVAAFVAIGSMWVRAQWHYRASFTILAIGSFVLTGLDFVGIAILFHTARDLGGFSLREVAFLYGGSGLGIALADFLAWGGGVGALGVGAGQIRVGAVVALTHGRVRR